jgi:hypothetical protein
MVGAFKDSLDHWGDDCESACIRQLQKALSCYDYFKRQRVAPNAKALIVEMAEMEHNCQHFDPLKLTSDLANSKAKLKPLSNFI